MGVNTMDDERQTTEQNAITTTHDLDFEVAPWDPSDTLLGRLTGIDPESDYLRFKVGTCDGLWTARDGAFVILSIVNAVPGNGHLEDVMQWFYFSCYSAGKHLVIEELMNKKFKFHLMQERGFKKLGGSHLIKFYSDIREEYQELMEDVTFNLEPETTNPSV